ncbi:CynX/NimT family MFS transporter [Geodermatophilus sp. CPCC 206100]|uniref:MFS transporter n=1 Tax=Geodermatophilus sp. CPCC 206100 TaxID=3020054 RepID=UPI003B00584D
MLSLMAGGVIGAAQIGKGAAALPILQDQFQLSASAAAWFLSVVSALGAVAGALLGWLGQALGFRRQVQLGLLAIGVCSALGAAAPSAGWLLAARVGEGLGFVWVVLAAPGLLPELAAPEQRRLVVGGWGAYMPVGAGLATLLVPPAVALIGWRGAWLVDAGLTACVLLTVTRWVPRPAVGSRPPSTAGLVTAVRSWGVLGLAALFGFYTAQYLALVGLFPSVLVSGGLGLGAAGLVGGLVFLVNAPGNLLGAALLHRRTPRRLMFVLGSAAMAVTVWGVLNPALPLAVRIASAMAFSFAAGLIPSAVFSGVTTLSAGTASSGASVGLLMQGSSLGQLLGPPTVVAVGASVGSWGAEAAALAVMAAFAGLLGWSWRDPDESGRSDP